MPQLNNAFALVRIVVFVNFGLVWIGCDAEASSSKWPVLFQKTSIIITSSNKSNEFTVELALTEGEQSQGLMFRSQLDHNAGMLFLFARVTERAMWMKNTFIPLDMLFIDAKGYIRKIVERTVPHSETVINSGVSIKAVLELSGGTAMRLGIRVGDQVSGKSMLLFR